LYYASICNALYTKKHNKEVKMAELKIKARVEDVKQCILNGQLKDLCAVALTGRIGHVYPTGEDSYYVHSNLNRCRAVTCSDGYLFAEVEE
jgi:hypothetical protein